MSAWFRDWPSALAEANRRAWATRRRYRVYFDPANAWWNVIEQTERHTR